MTVASNTRYLRYASILVIAAYVAYASFLGFRKPWSRAFDATVSFAIALQTIKSMKMPYRFIDDIATADIAFEAFGATLEEVFAAAAEALLDAMLNNPEALDIAKRENLILEAESAEMLLFDFLQELVFLKDRDQALLRAEEVVVAPHGDGYRLQAVLSGERLDYARHDLVVDVKAVTMHQFKLVPAENGWQARVVVDI